MPRFKGVDYYNIESLLTEEERLIRNTVRDFTDREVLPIIEEYYMKGTFPTQLVRRMGELGLLGMTLPEKYGGAGVSNVAYGLAMLELERGDSGIRSFASVQGGLVMYPIFIFGTEEQKQRYLPKLASGELIGCFGLTEPDYGSNPGGMLTKAEHTTDGYILNGTKMWITNGEIADLAIVWAKLEGKVRGFIVETDSEGFSASLMTGKHSLRASITSELILEDVFVPENALLPKTTGLRSPLMCLNQARYSIAWGVVGSMMACYDASLDYAKTRIQFDKPIAAYQLTQLKLVNMLTELTKAQLLVLQLGRLKDSGEVKHTQISMAKRNNVEQALKIAQDAREIHGANGILAEYPVMRHLNNLQTVKTYEGTHEMHTLIIGEDITGISAFL